MVHISKKDKSLILLILAVAVVIYGMWSAFSYVVFSATFKHSDINKIFPQDKSEEWLNVVRPLEISDLKDRIVLLDFWTYACVNCTQTIQEVRKLEEQFGSKLTVIGVHSGKFDNEKNLLQIRKAIIRNDITHPVINDSKMRIWDSFKIGAWPSFVLIDPRGNVVKTYVGEAGVFGAKVGIKKLISEYKYELNRDALPLALEKYGIDGNILSFPTKIEYAADFSYKSHHLPALFIANTGKNEILVTSLSGNVIAKIGSGTADFQDGNFETASFNAPQGLLYRSGKLYVADTGNHVLREIDFKKSTVTTLIGSGQRGEAFNEKQTIEANSFDLASPTDIEFFPNHENIVIANSGMHQILTYNIAKDTISVLAGSGVEGISDGKYPDNQLAQTADLVAYNRKLYFLDSETSSLRVMDESGEVKTLIGSDLFKFGNKNGGKSDALMQHPLGLMVDDTGVYISDSFNHVIRKYDFAAGKISNFVGSTKNSDGGDNFGSASATEFNQPEGVISVLNNFYVADTNNNRIVVINRGSLKSSLLDVMLPLKMPKEGFLEYLPNLKKAPDVKVKADTEIMLKVDLKKGWKINELGPSFINLLEVVSSDKANLVKVFDWSDIKNKEMQSPKLKAGEKYILQGVVYYCEDKSNALCYVKSYERKIIADDGEKNSEIIIKLAH